MADNLKQNYKLQQLFAILALPNIARACLVIQHFDIPGQQNNHREDAQLIDVQDKSSHRDQYYFSFTRQEDK